MAATTAIEAKPRKLFTVEGSAHGITTTLSKQALDPLHKAAHTIACLAKAGATFPKAAALLFELEEFIHDPTAKPKTENK